MNVRKKFSAQFILVSVFILFVIYTIISGFIFQITKLNEYKLLSSKLETLNPLSIMDKGYSISSVEDKIVTDVLSVKVGDNMVTKMKNGEIRSVITEVIQSGKE